EFLANMSHELRTPLNVILGYAELLEEEAEDHELRDLISDLYKIRHAGHHLLTLINHVLDLSKIEAGKMDVYPEEFDVSSLVRELSETVRLLMEQNGNVLYLHCQPDLGRMWSDPVKIRQGLLNLLSNAAKFTHTGTVTLEALRETGESGDWILFCITDTGIGIAPEQMGRLFEPFTQADPSTTRQYGGTGLGLALTRHFCYLLNGEVTVSSVPGQGSSFTMRLPAVWQLPEPAGTAAEALQTTMVEPVESATAETVNQPDLPEVILLQAEESDDDIALAAYESETAQPALSLEKSLAKFEDGHFVSGR
ncbi:MAG: sensor histidine kinase, partial [Candidatus Sericytochromatia bacterium]